MNRFFVPCRNIIEDNIIIDDLEQIHHISKALRFKIDDKIIIFDDKENLYEGIIKNIDNKKIEIKIIKSKKLKKNLNLEITLACAIPKKAKFDFIVEKTTELGISKIIPIETKNTIVQFDDRKIEQKLKRWQKIILSAAEQSKRINVPQIEPLKNFKDTLGLVKDYDLALIPCLLDPRKSIKEVLNNFKGKTILVFIGPEGDFTKEEVNLAIKAGCIPVSLGNTVLKVDTAAIAILSYINLSFSSVSLNSSI